MNRILLFLLLSVWVSISYGQRVYTWVDEHGVTHFGDAPLNRDAVKLDVQVEHPVVPPKPEPKAATASPEPKKVQPKIIMYGAAWCGVCKSARRYFKENNIRYTEYDIDNSTKGKRDYKRMKGTGVPIILVDGQRINGFSASRLDSILGRR